jgi:hypothetical protein
VITGPYHKTCKHKRGDTGLVGKREEMKPLVRLDEGGGIILKWILQKMNGSRGFDSSYSGRGLVEGCEHGNEPSDSMKCGEFLQ